VGGYCCHCDGPPNGPTAKLHGAFTWVWHQACADGGRGGSAAEAEVRRRDSFCGELAGRLLAGGGDCPSRCSGLGLCPRYVNGHFAMALSSRGCADVRASKATDDVPYRPGGGSARNTDRVRSKIFGASKWPHGITLLLLAK
jgi:hypothetical protein